MKEKILLQIIKIIESRILNAKIAMDAAQESANSEGKSSAGDKYETSRAMGQIDRDMYAKQMIIAENELVILKKINLAIKPISIGLGNIVETTIGIYFISISLGKVEIEGKMIIAISAKSPIGAMLMGKKSKDKFSFLGKVNTIISFH